MISLNNNILDLPHIGPTLAKRFKLLGIEKVSELLFHIPFRYDQFSVREIKDIKIGENVSINGDIDLIQNKRSYKRRLSITEAIVSDESGMIKVIWFNQPFLIKNLSVGDRVSLAGRMQEKNGELLLISPEYEKIRDGSQTIHTQGFIPHYDSTAGLSQKQIRLAIKQALPALAEVNEWLPNSINQKLKLITLALALEKIHFPKNENDIILARRRLAFAELFLRQLRSQLVKRKIKSKKAIPIPFEEKLIQEFVANLPWPLTKTQKQAAWEILQNINHNQPMSRLLEGDVGSGKTVVAGLALLNLAKNRYIKGQGALMAPTEILAFQHYQTFIKIFEKYGIKIGLITRSKKEANFPIKETSQNKKQTEILKEAQIIIGTHALIQAKSAIPNLLLAVIDEQHRFGVKQRQAILLQDQEITPHFLSMTATPIPRSLALSIYGDLDLSIISEMPANRKDIQSIIILNSQKQEAYKFIAKEIKAGSQAFVICPLIDESDKLEIKSVKTEFEYLQKEIFPEYKVAMLHGRLKGEEKEKIMTTFLNNEINILVSTSVVEVGIDVPNATVMLIEGADRFGLAQLHQFRGRIGRGDKPSYCLVSLDTAKYGEKARQRLKFFAKTSNGFELAKYDLESRGSGDPFGIIQSGFAEFKVASIFNSQLIKQAQAEATTIIETDPTLSQYPGLKQKLGHFEGEIHWE